MQNLEHGLWYDLQHLWNGTETDGNGMELRQVGMKWNRDRLKRKLVIFCINNNRLTRPTSNQSHTSQKSGYL